MVSKEFLTGALVSLILMACAGAGFKYYGMQGVSFENGTLLGPTSVDDLPFSRCMPNNLSKNPCIVMFASEFFALKQDYEDVKQKLKDCEKP